MSAAGRLVGRVIVVTGAGQGIGRAYAHGIAAEGGAVVVAELDATRAATVAAEIEAEGGQALAVETDVSDTSSCAAMVAAAGERFGKLDGLVNNAAIFATIRMRPFWELTEEEWDSLMEVNLKGVWKATVASLPALRESDAGSIVNISSGAYFLARPNYAHYMAAKAGVLGLTRAMARELGDDGIRVNAVTPGPVYTEVPRETVTEQQKQAMLSAQCLGRPAGPDDLVGAVLFLLSADSGFVTGQTVNVDGGLSFL